jgi:hypothetical protein
MARRYYWYTFTFKYCPKNGAWETRKWRTMASNIHAATKMLKDIHPHPIGEMSHVAEYSHTDKSMPDE